MYVNVRAKGGCGLARRLTANCPAAICNLNNRAAIGVSGTRS
jgi:hypothetical protein